MRQLPITGALSHSIRSTLNNLGFSFHLSWPWMLVILPFNLMANAYSAMPDGSAAGEISPVAGIFGFGVGVLTMIAFSSIAVSWHRYILLDEVPEGWRRLRLDNTVWRYFGNTLLIILMMFGAALPIGIVIALLILVLKEYAAILIVPLAIAAFLAAVSYSYQLGIKLPAIALQRTDYRFKNALADSQGNFWRFVGLGLLVGLITIILSAIIGVPTYLITQSQNATLLYVMVALQLVINWLATVWTVTMLTSLYGYFVERRDF